MGKRKSRFSSSQRWAIWTIFGMKCFKCKRPVEFDQCEIGRVIPESISKIVISALAKEYALGSDFSVNDLNNLVPMCRTCSKARGLQPSSVMASWFDLIRVKLPQVEAKVRLIDGDQSAETLLKLLVEKLESGDISPEDVEKVVKPFLESVEGKPKSTVELRLSDSIHLFFSEHELRRQPLAEIRYQKFVDGMVESGDWRKRKAEIIREGPTFGEGRPRRPHTQA